MEVAPSPLRANLRLMTTKEYLGGERKKMDEKELKNLLIGFLGMEAQMAEILPEVNDVKTLIVCWKNTGSGSKLRELVETQIVKVLSKIKDMETLMSHWRDTYTHWKDASSPDASFELNRLVETQILEILPEVNGMEALMSYRKVTDFRTYSRDLVDAQIIKATVSDGWFFAMIKDRSVPECFQDDFRQKAVELFSEL